MPRLLSVMPAESGRRAFAATPPLGAEEFADDRRLVEAILAKDRKATAQLVSRYADPVYSFVKRRLAPRADLVDDVVQDVFLAALANLASFRGTSSLRSWLLGIARHKVEGYYRDRLRAPGSLDDGERAEPASDGRPIDEIISREQLEARAHEVLGRLPETYRLALLWRYWEKRSAREIATATGRTEKAVERLLARARARFRDLWGT